MKIFENDFKDALEVSEQQIMNTFAFKKELRYGSKFQAVMTETIQLKDDYVSIKYQNEYETHDHIEHELNDDKSKLRRVSHDFSDDSDFNKDVQVVLDENNFNYYLMDAFH